MLGLFDSRKIDFYDFVLDFCLMILCVEKMNIFLWRFDIFVIAYLRLWFPLLKNMDYHAYVLTFIVFTIS